MSVRQGSQCGGSVASDRVVQYANTGVASLEDYKSKSSLPTINDVTSYPVLYQTAGASRKPKPKPKTLRKHKRKSSSKKLNKTKRKIHVKRKNGSKKIIKGMRPSRTLKKKRSQKGGNFLNMAGCGPVNAPDAGRKYSHLFNTSSSCPGPDYYRNPPGLEKAGSGQGSTFGPGAPYPFN